MWTSTRALSFDLDDTLWNVEPVIARAESALSAWLGGRHPGLADRYGPDVARDMRRRVALTHPDRAHDLSFVRTESLRWLARDAGLPAELADEAFAVFHRARNDVVPYPDVPSALPALASRFPLYALSNGNADIRRTVLAAHFRLGVSAGEVGVAKPDPRIFRHLLDRIGCRAEEVVHIGDDPVADVAGGRGVGCRTVWINREGRPWPRELEPPDAVIGDLGELIALLGASPRGLPVGSGADVEQGS